MELSKLKGNNHIMLDIESLGARYGAVVTSIGLVQFNPLSGETYFEDKWNLNIQEQINLGGKIDGSTLQWWFNQCKDAQEAMFKDPIMVKDVTRSIWHFANLVASDCLIDRKDIVWWANGSGFDFTLTNWLFDVTKGIAPWHYRNLWDLRTLKNMIGWRAPDEWFEEIVQHDALADCKLQVRMLKEVLENLYK